MENKIKFWIFYVLTVLTGAFAAFTYVQAIVTEFETITFIVVSFCVNFVFYLALIYGMPFLESDASAYRTTTTHTLDLDTGEISSSTFTAEEKAFWATFFKRFGLVVLCWLAAPVSQLIFFFVLPIARDCPDEPMQKAITIIVSIAAVAVAATLPLWAL